MSDGERPAWQVRLRHAVTHAAHLLPGQGPIGVFVHHNTLHAFEHLPFEEAVVEAARIFGAEPYLPESAYRAELDSGRIRVGEVHEIVDREPDAPILPGILTRRALRKALLTPGLRPWNAASVDWMLGETAVLRRFRKDLPPAVKHKLLEGRAEEEAVSALFAQCSRLCPWRVPSTPVEPARPRDGILAATGIDLDEVIHPLLIRLCEAFLDQGISYWAMPDRDLGFHGCVQALLGRPGAIFPRYLEDLAEAFRSQQALGMSAAGAVHDALLAFGIGEEDWEGFIQAELLALPGWAGMMHRLEEEPSLAPYEIVPCTLLDYLAVRLTMVRTAALSLCRRFGNGAPLEAFWRRRALPDTDSRESLVEAVTLFDAAQLLGLSATVIERLHRDEAERLRAEVAAFTGFERRRILHLAYELRHERQVLAPLESHAKASAGRRPDMAVRPSAQVMFCIDEREESLRRALEEVAPDIETFGAAGYFGVAVDYKGIDDAHGAPLCPVVVKPQHAVRERPVAADRDVHRMRRVRRLLWARFKRAALVSSRTLFRGWLSTAVLGILSLFPLIARVLAPRPYARLREFLNRSFFPEPRTELTLMRTGAKGHQTTEGLLLGFAEAEKIERVASVLEPAGMVRGFARLVVVLGHGSTSLNNPHESAHDCGACGGRRGGPNARLFAAMANREGVRRGLAERGILIDADTWFIGGYHDSCNDDIELFDLDLVPETHRDEVALLQSRLDRARALDAHERARRFEFAHPDDGPEQALRHAEERSEHIAEPRPEYGHATNAVCIVGRRSTTRGLFLDRRAFLASYDPALDPDGHSLARLLAAVVPVCAGINLEYYFSFVDNERYGCGTKLPHNVTGLVGVMNGHASDLRTGLPWQMVEIHEPVRLLLVVESTPALILRTFEASPALAQLLFNRWIRLAALDPDSGEIRVFRDGSFVPQDGSEPLPQAPSSMKWYRGRRGHLPLAQIRAAS